MSARNMKALRKEHAVAIKNFGKYLKISGERRNWQVWLTVRNQTFSVSHGSWTRAEAEWMRIMLCNALTVLVSEELTLLQMVDAAHRAGIVLDVSFRRRKLRKVTARRRA